MSLLPEGPPPITSSPAPGLLFPSTGTSCQSPASLSLGCALPFFFTQLQKTHREVPLPLPSQTWPDRPRGRGVQSGTTSAPSLRTSCTSQACSLSSPLFFHSTFLPLLTSPTITSKLVDLDYSLHLSCYLMSFSSPTLSHSLPFFLLTPSPFRPLFLFSSSPSPFFLFISSLTDHTPTFILFSSASLS